MDFDMSKAIEEMVKTKAEEMVKIEVVNKVEEMRIEDFIDGMIEEKLEEKFFKDDEHLEHYIIEATKPEMFAWFNANLSQEDILHCIKQTLIMKMRDFSIEELIKMFNGLKK